MPEPMIAEAHPAAADCAEPTLTTGGVSVATNLPHGLTVIHKGKRLRLNGANHKAALYVGGTESGKWGFTHNVDPEWFADWQKLGHPAVRNGLIRVNKPNMIAGQVTEQADEKKTGADRLIPEDGKKSDGVEKKTEKD